MPLRIDDGVVYAVDVMLGVPGGGGYAIGEWSGFFVGGDPDSWQTRDAYCLRGS